MVKTRRQIMFGHRDHKDHVPGKITSNGSSTLPIWFCCLGDDLLTIVRHEVDEVLQITMVSSFVRYEVSRRYLTCLRSLISPISKYMGPIRSAAMSRS